MKKTVTIFMVLLVVLSSSAFASVEGLDFGDSVGQMLNLYPEAKYKSIMNEGILFYEFETGTRIITFAFDTDTLIYLNNEFGMEINNKSLMEFTNLFMVTTFYPNGVPLTQVIKKHGKPIKMEVNDDYDDVHVFTDGTKAVMGNKTLVKSLFYLPTKQEEKAIEAKIEKQERDWVKAHYDYRKSGY